MKKRGRVKVMISKQTKYNHSAIMRLYGVYFNLINAQDYTGMQDVYSLITSITLEGSRSHSKRF